MEKIIVKASAGTGKTYKISLEYIKMLLANMKVEEILVTTFTRKATYEIKERIFSLLKELAEGKNDLIENLSISVDKINEIYKNLIVNKSKMRIYTIDSFINSIFNKFIVPYSHLYGYELIDENKNEKYYEEILQFLIQNEKKFSEINKFFNLNFEKDITDYVKWIKEFLSNRWYFLITTQNEHELKTIEIIEVEKDFEKVISKVEELIEGKVGSLIDYIKEDLKPLIFSTNKKEYFEKNYNFLLEDYIWNGIKLRSNKSNEILFNNLLKIYDSFRKSLANYIYFNKVIPLETELFKIGNIIFEEYDSLKERVKKFTYNDLLIYTYKFIYNIEESSKIVQQDIKVMLIDEFQDTSVLQWLILKPFIIKSLKFIAVGDEKQAIYGWRGSEKGLFKNLVESLKAKEEKLTISYRSEKEIINFTNKFFNNLGLLNYEIKSLPTNSKGYVEVKGIEKDNFSKEIVNLILNKKLNFKSTCILCRTNKDLEELSIHLTNMNIPFIKESSLNLLASRAIKPLYWLLKFTLTSNFTFLLNFLRSEVVEITSEDLKNVINKRESVENFFKGSSNLEINEKLLIILKELKNLKNMHFKILIEKSLEIFSFKKIFPLLIDIKNIKLFLEKAKKFNNLNDFINYLEENQKSEELKQVGIEEIDALKLMTIHKSKGLEFETLILYWNFSGKLNISREKLSFNVSFEDNFEKVESYCFTTKNLETSLEYCGFNYAEKEKEKSWEEEKNSLYVGLTRAKRNLFFFISFDRSLEALEKISNENVKNYSDKIYYEVKETLKNSLNITKIEEIYIEPYSIGNFSLEDFKEPEKEISYIDFSFLKEYFSS